MSRSRKIVWMHLGPHLRKSLRRRIRTMPVNVAIAHVVVELAAFQVEAPGAKLCTVEGQL